MVRRCTPELGGEHARAPVAGGRCRGARRTHRDWYVRHFALRVGVFDVLRYAWVVGAVEPRNGEEGIPLRKVTYGELYALVADLVSALLDLGLQPGDRVASYCSNCIVSVAPLSIEAMEFTVLRCRKTSLLALLRLR